ncbi:C-factor-like [Protopterus annectens]|uniref:C-factor-like n=1 Tax=Protopterus annectens TaxID=7888 RepID=UPI001CFB943E|nr:C-factor-like [Protopterus annectens]
MALRSCGSVLITGSNRGIGLALVRELVTGTPSPKVVIGTCRKPQEGKELQDLAKKYSNFRVVQLDVNDEDSIQKAVKEVEGLTGNEGLNCLINNAGTNTMASLNDVNVEVMMSAYRTNSVGVLMVTKAFLPLLKKAANLVSGMGVHRAAIINVSSDSGSIQLAEEKLIYLKVYPYRISKTALNMISKCLALDLKSEGILCIAFHPGWIQTDMGGPLAPLTLEETIPDVVTAISNLEERHSGTFIDWKGNTVPW